MRSLAVFFVGFMICYFLTNEWVLDFLRAPLFKVLPPEQHKLYFTSLFENFLTHLKVAAVAAVFLFSPYFLFEFWAFIAPGLYARERKMVVPFILGGATCFIGGAAFAYYVLFPVAFQFFVTYGSPSDVPMLTINAYYSTCLKLLLLFGLAFELPVVICFLGALGVIDAPFLRQYRRVAIIIITVLCAMFAPPDALSMVILMVPLILLYEIAIWIVARMGVRRRDRDEAGAETAAVAPVSGGDPEPAVRAAKDGVPQVKPRAGSRKRKST